MKTHILFLIAITMIASYSLTAQVSITLDGSSPDSSAMLDVKSTDRGMLTPRMTMAQRIAINDPANGLMVYQINGTSGFYYFGGGNWKRIGENAGHYVGEPHGGGIIFYVNEDGDHGLICSMIDLDTSQAWSNVTNALIGDSAQSVWNGPRNSIAIVNQDQHVTSAAQLCLDYTNAGYGNGTYYDWYLMSIGEARHLRNNSYQVQKALELDGDSTTKPISNGPYWSSSESSASSAWAFSVNISDDGENWYNIIKSEPLIVRAVRAF